MISIKQTSKSMVSVTILEIVFGGRLNSKFCTFSVRIRETGCSKRFHCEGGSVCIDRQCVCPPGYRATAKFTKCARIGGKSSAEIRDFMPIVA